MSIDQRLARLSPALTAQERAILILQSWKEGKPEDPAWRRAMPPAQAPAFNHYIDLMNAANRFLGAYVGHLYHAAEKVELRRAWLVSFVLWQEHIDEIGRAVHLAVKEPVTESEHRAKVEAARNEWVPVEELAGFLAGQRNDWTEEDYEETEDGVPALTDAAWDRALADEDRRLRRLVTAGTLRAKGKGKAMKLQECALEHFGHEVGSVPEDFLAYRVAADTEADAVAQERALLKNLQSALSWRSEDDDHNDTESPTLPEKMMAMLRETLAYELISTWVQVRSVEVVLDEIAVEFGGSDALKPDPREKLDETKQKIQSVHDELLALLKFDAKLREPLEEELEELRALTRQVRASW